MFFFLRVYYLLIPFKNRHKIESKHETRYDLTFGKIEMVTNNSMGRLLECKLFKARKWLNMILPIGSREASSLLTLSHNERQISFEFSLNICHYSKRTRTFHRLCWRPGCYHGTRNTHVRHRIFKLTPFPASLIYQILWIHWIRWISVKFRENSIGWFVEILCH